MQRAASAWLVLPEPAVMEAAVVAALQGMGMVSEEELSAAGYEIRLHVRAAITATVVGGGVGATRGSTVEGFSYKNKDYRCRTQEPSRWSPRTWATLRTR